MEKEYFFTGYCRQTDGARTVCVVTEENCLEEADCCYPDCPYASECGIAKSIAEVEGN